MSSTAGGPLHAVRSRIPTADFWSARHTFPPGRRSLAAGAANGFLYAIGGANLAGTTLRTVTAYNPSTNTWITKAQLPAAREGVNGATAIGSTLYLPGGFDAAGSLTRTLYAYNANTNHWASKANMPVVGGCGGSAVIGGKLYVFSGCTRSASGAQIGSALLHRYDPLTNTWLARRSAPQSHFQPVVAAIGGKLYVVGGNSGTGTGVATGRVDVYDAATNLWSRGATMPTPRVTAAVAVVGGKLQVMGGRDGATYLDAVEVYDPVTNAWSKRAPMITGRAALGTGTVNGFIYAVGGKNGSKVLALNERYTP